MADKSALYDRFMGYLLGLAVGDALGTTLEFKAPGSFTPLEDMIGGGPFDLKLGEWTDDTSMALCLDESLIERPSFDPVVDAARAAAAMPGAIYGQWAGAYYGADQIPIAWRERLQNVN